MKNKIFLGCLMAIISMTCSKEFSSFQSYTINDSRIICSNTNNDEFDEEEENIPTPFCDLPPQD